MITIKTPSFKAQVFDSDHVTIQPNHTPMFTCSLADLAFVLLESQEQGILLRVKIDFSQWRGIVGS